MQRMALTAMRPPRGLAVDGDNIGRILAQAAMANRDKSVAELCKELKIRPITLYRYVDPNGNLRDYGKRVLNA